LWACHTILAAAPAHHSTVPSTSRSEAVQLHQDFKFRKIAGLPRDKAWSMSEDEVAREVAQIKKNRRP
jgi:hypothetical protein